MEICNNNFENLLASLMRQKNLEQNLSTVVRNMENEIQFQSLGIFLKVPSSNIYRLKISRNISHNYEKNTSFFDDDNLISELHKLSIIRQGKIKRYKFEKDYKYLLINPLYNNQELFGFIFMDSANNDFTEEDEMKFGIFSSLLSIIVSMNNLRHEVEMLSDLDELTQFLTYQAFVERSKVIFAQMKRYDRKLTLIFMKLNNFNNIVRTIGKDNAHDLVKQIAEILKQELRASDLLGILNPDTFTILLPETDTETSFKVIKRINAIINSLPLMLGYRINWGLKSSDEKTKKFKNLINLVQDAIFESGRKTDNNITIG